MPLLHNFAKKVFSFFPSLITILTPPLWPKSIILQSRRLRCVVELGFEIVLLVVAYNFSYLPLANPTNVGPPSR